MIFISEGTPGRQANAARPMRHPDARRRADAVGQRLGPSGNSAWTRFRSAIARLRRANIAAIAASEAGSSTSGTPAAWARASRVRSSWVGPEAAGHDDQVGPVGGDPEGRDVLVQVVAERRVEGDRDAQRTRARWLSHWLLVSRDCPLTSSLPIEMISAFMDVAAPVASVRPASVRLTSLADPTLITSEPIVHPDSPNRTGDRFTNRCHRKVVAAIGCG